MKKYNIIYADPAWSYKSSMKGDRGVLNHYDVLSIEDLKALPISNLADDDCILFLWVTMPKLDIVFDVIRAWGFEYKTCAFNWTKMNKKANTPFMGMGRWTRANNEICLLSTKGKPKRINAGVRMLIETYDEDDKVDILHSRIREHSKKPDEVRDRIVQLMGDLPRVELFAREKVKGWDSIGFDIDGRDIREVLKGWGN